MTKKYSMELGGRTLSCEIGKVAELAGGAALMSYGETVVLVTATTSDKPRAGIDWFPLSCDFEERLYAIGKIPGNWFRREGRPMERAILASRLIDRPIRPLFPDDYRNDVGVVATVLSVDQDASAEIAAMIGSSIALCISDIPFDGPTSAVNIGLVDGQLIVNPDMVQREVSKLALTVSSTRDKVMMIEAGADEVDEQLMYDAIMLAHEENKKVIAFIDEIVREHGKPKREYDKHVIPEDLYNAVKNFITDARMEEAVFQDQKQVRDEKVRALTDEAVAALVPTFAEDVAEEYTAKLGGAIYKYEKDTVRRMIFSQHKRPDGRGLGDIRRLEASVDILPRTHGSALFSRGQTQVLTVTTLGSSGDTQRLDGLDEAEEDKRYMHHYNFPSYSVGETRPSRGPGRREIGHGALAERALLPVIPNEDDFPYVIRLVSEVVSSNGSTSQAAVCGSTLSLMAAGVPIKRPVAGISVGLVTGETENDFVLLTDIQGLEDFFGDMDFKVAGTSEGITAIQMDIKINGLTPEIIRASLEQTREARMKILNESMLPAIGAPRPEISQHAPKIAIVRINVEQIGEVIGPRGKVINRIIEESGVDKIDTEDDGRVFVVSRDQTKVDRAVEIIKAIVSPPEVGKHYTGKVTRLMSFGAFVEIAPEKEGLVHISQLAVERVEKVEDVVKVGDELVVKVTEVDDQGRINLSRKAVIAPELGDGIVKRPPPKPREGGGFRAGDRGDRNRGGGGRR
ncbi:MAG: polyribonucleotide nucleotidyltransferase [Defluviitaleaceae bacterium]|nr:polyribonucleotide nucleotidyltransferase [Defluviitaleaceae bacterium]MCL2261956.1 polyribonucleotide nucleotidyltransferase [Defluviitaleaceae bacterium]